MHSLFDLSYTCPSCGAQWSDVWENIVEDDCPGCGLRHIEPIEVADADEDD